MPPSSNGSLPLRNEQDLVSIRQTVRRLTRELDFSLVDQTRMITAAGELSRNTVVYGGGGEMRWEMLIGTTGSGLRLHFEDKGPGIADLERALSDGRTSGKGLAGSRRLVDDFKIRSAAGEGTCVTITRWK